MDDRKYSFARNTQSIDRKYIPPLRVFLITIAAIFLAEVFAMLVIARLPAMPYALETIVDGLIITAMVFPFLYFLIFRSMLVQIAERERAETELRGVQAGLEQRTHELAHSNQELKDEIAEREQAESQLRLLSTALEAAANGVIITEQHGNILWANPAFSRMTGYSLEQVLGQNPRLLNSGKHEPEFYRQLWETILSGQVWQGETTNRCKDGSLYIEEQTITPLLDEKGEITHFIAIKHDITQRKQAEIALLESEEKFRTLVNWTYDWEKWVDPQGNIVYTSPSCERITGYLPDEFISDPSLLMNIVHPDDRKSYDEHNQLIHDETVGVSNVEYRIIARDGTEHWIDHICRPLFGEENQYLGRRVSCRDITERKKIEEQLARQNKELLDLTNAERKQRQAAEALCAAAQSFTQNLRLEYVVGSLLDHINRIIPYDTASVALLEEEGRLAVRAVRGNGHWTDFSAILAEPVATNSIVQELLSSRKSLLIPNVADYPFREIIPEVENIQSWLVAAIVTGENAIGVVWLGKNEPEFFALEHAGWTEALASQAGVAIQNAWLFEQVRANSERLQFLTRRLVEVQENELRYIAQELHDEVGQALTSLTLGLHLIQKEADKPEVVRTELAKMDQVVDNVMENLHRLAMDLRPASLDHLGLEAALRQHIQTLREKLSLEIKFGIFRVNERLPANMEIALYRIVQEALNNVVRHARATRVDVIIQRRDDILILIVEDNGVGYDPAVAMKSERLGFFGMRERAEMLGGKLVVESAAGRGTTVFVEVPYASSNSHRG